MTCLECKHFKRLKDGQKGSIKGSCKLKCSDSYQDWRYGRQKACKAYFERREQMKEQTKEDIDRAFKALQILEEAVEQGKQKEFNQNKEVQFMYCGRKFAIRELAQ